MVITLTGFMACGKSTIGRALAADLGVRFVDLDDAVVESEDRSIPEIFAAEGEEYFRECEYRCLLELLEGSSKDSLASSEDAAPSMAIPAQGSPHGSKPALVIALGGGAVTYPKTRDVVLAQTLCIYLKVDFATISQRLRGVGAATRPLAPSAAALFAARAPIYELAHITVIADDSSISHTVERISQCLRII